MRATQERIAATDQLSYSSVCSARASNQGLALSLSRVLCENLAPQRRKMHVSTRVNNPDLHDRLEWHSFCCDEKVRIQDHRTHSRQSLSAENLGWLGHSRSRQCGAVLRFGPQHFL